MKNIKTACLLIAIILCVLSLVGCGSNSSSLSKGVPDHTAELVVLDYLDERGMRPGDYNSYSFNVVHNYDKESNSDAAAINLKIEYNYATESTYVLVWYSYNKSSDLWTLDRKGSWSESAFSYFGDKLVGRWRIEYFDDYYEIEIESISGDSVTLNYSIWAEATVGMGLYPDRTLMLDGGGTYTLENQWIRIPFDLPDGFYCNKGGGRVGEKSTDLNVCVDPQQGCNIGFINGMLSYVAP